MSVKIQHIIVSFDGFPWRAIAASFDKAVELHEGKLSSGQIQCYTVRRVEGGFSDAFSDMVVLEEHHGGTGHREAAEKHYRSCFKSDADAAKQKLITTQNRLTEIIARLNSVRGFIGESGTTLECDIAAAISATGMALGEVEERLAKEVV